MSNTASFELSQELKAQIAQLALMLDRSKSWIVRQALNYGLPIVARVERRPGKDHQ